MLADYFFVAAADRLLVGTLRVFADLGLHAAILGCRARQFTVKMLSACYKAENKMSANLLSERCHAYKT